MDIWKHQTFIASQCIFQVLHHSYYLNGQIERKVKKITPLTENKSIEF